jgi:NADPH-dependent 7-cyano-7-deazaguanine reductase QueF
MIDSIVRGMGSMNILKDKNAIYQYQCCLTVQAMPSWAHLHIVYRIKVAIAALASSKHWLES